MRQDAVTPTPNFYAKLLLSLIFRQIFSIDMIISGQSIWARANAAFRNRDFETSVVLYEEAFHSSEKALKSYIKFNLNLSKKRLSINTHAGDINIKADDDRKDLFEKNNANQSNNFNEIEEILRPYFDRNYYSAKYPDISKLNIDFLEHYIATGWREGRNPNSGFSTKYYLASNPDVISAGINPFWHYIVAGKSEGRPARHPGGYKAEILSSLLPLEKITLQWKKAEALPMLLSCNQVAEIIAQGKSNKLNRLIISIGHDHYKKISGGIQLCIQKEERIAADGGMLYLNAHPWQALPRLTNDINEADPILCLVMAGCDVGVCRASVLTKAIDRITDLFKSNIHVIIHSLLGHSVEWVTKLVLLRSDRKCWLWLHDFFTLCPSFTLQRNSISYCGAPAIDSNACTICIYSEERRSHERRVRKLFEETAVTVISPSEVTKRFWRSKVDFPIEQLIVIPHIVMQWLDREAPLDTALDAPIAIAFLGAPVHHKGWNVFELIAKTLAADTRFRFVYLGHYQLPLSGIESINVHTTADDGLKMAQAVADSQVDFVLHWATWPETFSFTTYEAIAGGAYVLTNPISGNVAATVASTGMGAVFEHEQALLAFFQEGEATRMVETGRRVRATRQCQSIFSNMTMPLLTNGEFT